MSAEIIFHRHSMPRHIPNVKQIRYSKYVTQFNAPSTTVHCHTTSATADALFINGSNWTASDQCYKVIQSLKNIST